MTDEEAMQIWWGALEATGTGIQFKRKPDLAAARVIQTACAEREAAKDAEIARLREAVLDLAANIDDWDSVKQETEFTIDHARYGTPYGAALKGSDQ